MNRKQILASVSERVKSLHAEGLSNADIAKIIGLSEASVRVFLLPRRTH